MHLIPAAVGVIIAAATGVVIAIAMNANGWWLDDGARVRDMVIVLAIAALIAGLVGDARFTIPREIALWLGFVVGMTGVLFSVGPGTIFPIVIAVGASLAALAVTVGAAPAFVLRR